MNDKLVQAIEHGAVVVTATQRLGRALRASYDRVQTAAGRRCWAAGTILPLGSWLRGLWEASWTAEVLVPEPVVLALWEEIIAEDSAAHDTELLDVSATAALAQEAHRLSLLYEIEYEAGPQDSAEARAMGRWGQAFRERLAQGGWTDPSALAHRVSRLLSDGALPAPPAVFLAGFDEIPPAQKRLLDALGDLGTKVERVPFPSRQSRPLRVQAPDARSEVRMAARWAREAVLRGAGLRVGVVAPSLEAYGGLVESVFPEELSPSSVLPGAGDALPVFDLSLGRPLSREPLVANALDLLALGRGPAEWEDWSSLLRSPFWGSAAAGGGEVLARAGLDARLSCLSRHEWTLAELAREAVGSGLPSLAETLGRVSGTLGEDASKGFPSYWATRLTALLKAARWGAGRVLTSREHQAGEALREALVRLRALDVLGRTVDRPWALSQLRKLLSEPFRPEVGETPVLVLGMLEASGLEFDRLWVLGVHADALPSEPRANPFLPYPVQVAAGVRQATPEGELHRARAVVARLLASADEVVVSYPATWEGKEMGPSPLIRSLAAGEPTLAEPASLKETLRRSGTRLEIAPDAAPPLDSQLGAPGGTKLLADQAVCPFRGFAVHRLRAWGPGSPDAALQANERGTAVHAALEALSGLIPGSSELAGLSEAEVEERISQAAEAGLRSLEKGRRAPLPAGLRNVEERRMSALLREWVEAERGRPAYRVVEREGSREAEVEGLRFSVRVDRIDECEEGRQLLIDYKTGKPKVGRWFEERPREPQLPLYALACPEAAGATYGVVRRGKCVFEGVGEGGELAPGMKDVPPEVGSWEELRRLWEERLCALAREVREGRADVSPVDADACRYCELPALCRVAAQAEEEDE